LCKDLFFSSSDLSNFFFLGCNLTYLSILYNIFFIKEIVKLESFFLIIFLCVFRESINNGDGVCGVI
jgi:hypothetical protein